MGINRIYASDINKSLVDQPVKVAGWVHRRRDHGGVIFFDLRDRSGLVQVVAEPSNVKVFEVVDSLRAEYVVELEGVVRARPSGMENLDLPSGAVEIVPNHVNTLARSKTPPFMPQEAEDVDELIRLKYRYIDLRRPGLLHNFLVRDRVLFAIREFFHHNGFLDVETPSLARSTPEGARDFLVPSRLHPGEFYALPQSPQIFKQLLMVAGFDRYYQIAKVFRDEDLRADRQPEFTQVDVEMSFMDQEEIFLMMEEMLRDVFLQTMKVSLDPFVRMTWHEAMHHYGSDKPDLRAGEPLKHLTEVAHNTPFTVFREAQSVVGIVLRNYQPSRKQLDHWVNEAKNLGASGLIWLVEEADGRRSSIQKVLGPEGMEALSRAAELRRGDSMLMVAGGAQETLAIAGQLRLLFARKENRLDASWRFLWVTDFPLFEWSEQEQGITSAHHPFTMPHPDDIVKLESDPLTVRSQAYDVVLNGFELASGSMRIYQPELQSRIFQVLGLSPDEIDQKFGFLVRAFDYGAPPHGGIAFGVDRLVMLMVGAKNLREVIAFPKTARGTDPLMDAPNAVDERQLQEVHLRILQ